MKHKPFSSLKCFDVKQFVLYNDLGDPPKGQTGQEAQGYWLKKTPRPIILLDFCQTPSCG